MFPMTKPTKAEVKRILGALKRSKKKFVPLESLSRLVGLYPDVLADTLAYFEPMIRMDPSINTRDLTEAMNAYLAEPVKVAPANKPKRQNAPKKEVAKYASVADFVYKKMTSIGGLVDVSVQLSDEDLLVLQKLIQNEQNRRKRGIKKK